MEWDGKRGRADVADLLGRFQKVDAGKARDLQEELFRQSGHRIPFRVAPMREDDGEGPDDPETIRLPRRNPWGSTEGANPWEVDSMAKVLLDRTDYKDAVKHFAGEFQRDPEAARPYTAAIYQAMADKKPAQALQFARQMAAGGLAKVEEEPEEPAPPSPESKPEPETAPPPPPNPTPSPRRPAPRKNRRTGRMINQMTKRKKKSADAAC